MPRLGCANWLGYGTNVMEIFVYRANQDSIEEGFPLDELPALLEEQSNVVWINFDAPSLEDDHILLDVFKFHPLTVEDCRVNRHHPKLEEYPDYLFFIFHGVRSNSTPEGFHTIELDGYLGHNFVVTYHHEPFASIEKFKQRIRSNPMTCQRGAAFLLHGILDQTVDDYMPVMEALDERLDEIEDRIFALRSANNNLLEEIQDLKRGVLRLRRISSKQLDALFRITRGEFMLINENLLPFYRDVQDHMVRVYDLAENYRDMIASTQSTYLSVLSNRLNEVMKVLTIISAIGVPLTVIVGIYGMNFDYMPELHSRWGYFGVWIMMIVVVVIMLRYFRRKGWIGKDDVLDTSEK